MTVLTKFGESLGGKLADRWLTVASTGPFAFAVAGLGAWLVHEGPVDGWRRLEAFLAGVPTGRLLVALVAGVLVLTAAGAVATQLATPVLRLLEGYWPTPLHPLGDRLADRAWDDRKKAVKKIRELGPVLNAGKPTPAQSREASRAEAVRSTIPSKRALVQPTALGNLLRAAESRSGERYGLDAVVVWPSLWLVLPDAVRAELVGARTRVDRSVVGMVWCVLVAVWAGWTLWALLVAALATIAAYRWWLRPAVEALGDLVEAAFHAHRFALYAALRLPPPHDAGTEKERGAEVTEYLRVGSDDRDLAFDHTQALPQGSPPPAPAGPAPPGTPSPAPPDASDPSPPLGLPAAPPPAPPGPPDPPPPPAPEPSRPAQPDAEPSQP